MNANPQDMIPLNWKLVLNPMLKIRTLAMKKTSVKYFFMKNTPATRLA